MVSHGIRMVSTSKSHHVETQEPRGLAGSQSSATSLLRDPRGGGSMHPYAAILGLRHPLGAFVSLLGDVTSSFYCCCDGCINLYLMGRSAIGHGATAV